MKGKIIKGVGGFYYIHLHDNRVFECKAKGVFRNQGIKPAVGDDVEIDIIDAQNMQGNLVSILPRKNKLVRPAVSNVDQAVIIFALSNPEPNYNLLDRFLIMMEQQGVETIICLNKADIADSNEAARIKEIYEACGYKVFVTSTCMPQNDTDDKSGIEGLRESIKGRTTVFAGPSGVGKSSLLNVMQPDAQAKIGAVSDKIKRGKHTTRHSELMYVCEDTFIMDTPGFSSLYVENVEPDALKEYYNEFASYSGQCRFHGCLHINEPDCGVKQALCDRMISSLRYDNYRQIYEELKSKRRW